MYAYACVDIIQYILSRYFVVFFSIMFCPAVVSSHIQFCSLWHIVHMVVCICSRRRVPQQNRFWLKGNNFQFDSTICKHLFLFEWTIRFACSQMGPSSRRLQSMLHNNMYIRFHIILFGAKTLLSAFAVGRLIFPNKLYRTDDACKLRLRCSVWRTPFSPENLSDAEWCATTGQTIWDVQMRLRTNAVVPMEIWFLLAFCVMWALALVRVFDNNAEGFEVDVAFLGHFGYYSKAFVCGDSRTVRLLQISGVKRHFTRKYPARTVHSTRLQARKWIKYCFACKTKRISEAQCKVIINPY